MALGPFLCMHAQDGALVQPSDKRHTVKQRGLPLAWSSFKFYQAKSLKKSVDSHQKKERWKNYVKLQEYCLFIFWQGKFIEDEWFTFLKFVKLIHSAGLASWLSKKNTLPKVVTVKNQFFQDHHAIPM